MDYNGAMMPTGSQEQWPLFQECGIVKGMSEGSVCHRIPAFLVTCLVSLFSAGYTFQEGPSSGQAQAQREEVEDYFTRWLQEDVSYIVTGDEKAVFESLSTPEEKEQFIEQFWYRRDPDFSTAENEFKEEHYRRIAFANERFTSGVSGWKTDRGRIYIIHGPPAEIEKHYSGENYQRPAHEGGGFTAVFPFEIWRYRFVEGIGSDIELEFVDTTGSGEFRLARNPWEKDAFLFFQGAGLTDAEGAGLARREDRPYFKPYNLDRYPLMHTRAGDDPFSRYELLNKIQRPPEIRYRDLKEIVDVNLSYDELPVRLHQDFFQVGPDRVLVPVTIEIENRELNFVQENDVHVARVAIYGLITSITRRVVAEFEDDVLVSYQPEYFQYGLNGRSVYQKTVLLEPRVRYRIDLVVKDLNGDKVGVRRAAIAVPNFGTPGLRASSVILSDYVRPLADTPLESEMFVIGDIKIRPNLKRQFGNTRSLAVYLHLYNCQIDQSSQLPAVSVRYRILRAGKQVKYWSEDSGESVQFFSAQRVVLLRGLPLTGLEAGEYRLEIEATDRLSGDRLALEEEFQVLD